MLNPWTQGATPPNCWSWLTVNKPLFDQRHASGDRLVAVDVVDCACRVLRYSRTDLPKAVVCQAADPGSFRPREVGDRSSQFRSCTMMGEQRRELKWPMDA
jgi:hypothetical protein